MTFFQSRRLVLPLLLVIVAALVGAAWARRVQAQVAPALSDERLLAMVLPPLADGSRPPVHFWARADQPNGPGGLPTVFVVTLYTHQTDAGSDEREVVNYVQYSGGNWALARPQDAGTLLTDDWAWVSLNLANLSASAQGQGDASQYTVDYDAKGNYNGTPRELMIEEVYAADLSLVSSTILSDTSGQSVAVATTTVNATDTPAPTSVPTASAPASTTVAAVRPVAAPGAVASPSATGSSPAPLVLSAPNTIRSAAPASDTATCGPALAALGYTWNGATKALGAISGQSVLICTPSNPQVTPPDGASYGCLLVGGQPTTLDGDTACFAYTAIQPQGSGNFLVVHQSSGASTQVQPIAWGSAGFASGQPYAACNANIAIPVTDTSVCSTGS